jgi:cyanamide hydratase
MTYAPGFLPVSRNPAELPYADAASGITLADLPLPSSDLIEEAKQFLKPILGEPVWNHSHRAFLFGEYL